MYNEVFSIPSEGFSVFREADGSLHWLGDFKGIAVTATLPVDGGSKCLILLDMVASNESAFENLLCVNRNGNVEWKAELPDTNDAFVGFQMATDGLYANTWNGYRVTIDPATGKLMQQKFVK